MADDTYHPTGSHPQPSGLIVRQVVSGSGAPDSTAGVAPDAIYIDTDTGDFYQNVDGTWTLVFSSGGGGGGGTDQIHFDTVDASGTPTGGKGVWINTATGKIWVYNSATSASWVLFLG